MSNNAKSSTMFTKLKEKRGSFERIWELCAQYTLPQFYLSDEVRESGTEPEDLVIGDSIGAEGLNNFISQVSKLAFPAQGAFFRVEGKKGAENLSKLSKQRREDIYRRLEEASMQELYMRGLHAQKFMLVGTLLCLGDVTYRVPLNKKSKIQVYDMNDVVIKRSRNGRVVDIIIKEDTEFRYLSREARDKLSLSGKMYKDDDIVSLYTHIFLDTDIDKMVIKHSVDDIPLDTKENFCIPQECEYQVGSLTVKRGSHYGTGVVQQYLPLIHKANVYADTATDTAVAGSLVNWAVAPSATVRPEEFANREQGQPFGVKPQDIQPIQANVGQHLQITQQQYAQIVNTLQRVFLMFTAVQRDAERVTAQEIRMVAQKLEETHFGLYATIAENLQRPLAHLGLSLIDDEELTPYKDEVEIKVVTAMEAQSRGVELDNILGALNSTTILNSVPPQVQEHLKISNLENAIFNNHNVTPDEFIKSEEEVQAERQALAEAEAQAQGQQPQLNQTQVFQANEGLLEDIQNPLI